MNFLLVYQHKIVLIIASTCATEVFASIGRERGYLGQLWGNKGRAIQNPENEPKIAENEPLPKISYFFSVKKHQRYLLKKMSEKYFHIKKNELRT